MRLRYYIPFLLFLATCQSKPKGELLPDFDILLSDSATRLHTADIKAGRPIALLYFSPSCEHCQEETRGILHHIDSLKDVHFYFVTNEDFGDMKTFANIYQLHKYPNITIGRDDQFFMIRHFKGIFPPYMVIYDQRRKQRAIFGGERTPSELISFINHL